MAGADVKWFKKDRRAPAKASAASGPAISTGSSDSGDTEERLEHESQQSTESSADPPVQRRSSPTAASYRRPVDTRAL